jgi:thiol-disulfide isomerase/thioredoxin
MTLMELGSSKDLVDLLRNNKNVCITFSAHWCGPCKRSKPQLDQLATKICNNNKSNVVDLKMAIVYESDLGNDILYTFNIRAFPTYIFFVHGQEKQRVQGANLGLVQSMLESQDLSQPGSFDTPGAKTLGGTTIAMTTTTTRPTTTMEVVPPELLLDFIYKATKDLEELTIGGFPDASSSSDQHARHYFSRGDIRQLLLHRQHVILNQVVDEFNNNNSTDISRNDNDDSSSTKLSAADVQNALKAFAVSRIDNDDDDDKDDNDQQTNQQISRTTVQKASKALNEAARLCYCRLVLFSGCLQKFQWPKNSHQQRQEQQHSSSLRKSGGMSRDDLLELCGLCTTVLRLPLVQRHLQEPGHGTPLFDAQQLQRALGFFGSRDLQGTAAAVAAPLFTSIFPHERLEHIQRVFLQMIGYDADYGTAEIKRIFYNANSNDNEFTRDPQVMQVFGEMMTQIQISLSQATARISQYNFSDHDQGGCTRIVAVDYSEHEIDARTGEVISSEASIDDTPAVQAMEEHVVDIADNDNCDMRRHCQEQQALRTAAVATARLQQEILAQVLSLPEAERQDQLDRAKQVSDEVVNQVLLIAPGPGRVEFFQSLDAGTQRLLALHKLWETHVTSKHQASNSNTKCTGGSASAAKIRYATGFAPE